MPAPSKYESYTFGYHWVAEADDIYAPLQHLIGKLSSQSGIAQHHGDNRMLVTLWRKAPEVWVLL